MIKDYIIKERLGIGAFGIVYKVLKKTNNNIYVIKQVPLFGLTPKQISDVKLEAKILSSVKSIYIVRYYDSFEENNYLNIVMEYCDGGDLSQFIEKNKGKNKLLDEDIIWTIFLKITIGLATLHKSKILHRDLKSLNIFLTKDLDIKIGDFGVAKILTQTGFAKTIIGTPYYLSPELCDEQPYNDKSDVWALGCILYELCTYNHPFNAKCQASLILKIIQTTPEPINKDYSENLQKLINIILDKNYLTRPSCFDILNMDFVIEKAKNIGLYEKIKCLYPELILNKNKIQNNNCFQSCANFSQIKNTTNNPCDNINHNIDNNKRILQTEEVGKSCNYSKVVVKKYINLDSFNKKSNKSKSKDKNQKQNIKKYNIIYFESKSNDKNIKNKNEDESKKLNFKKIKERIERLESRSRSKSYEKIRNRSKKNKEKIRTNNISHNKSKSINKSKSTNKKNRINKSIENFEKNLRKKTKSRKGVLILHKSKTPLKFKSNYLSLNDDELYNNLNNNDILNNKNIDKIMKNEISEKNEIRKMTNMTDFANFLNNYSTQHKKTELNNNSNSKNNKFFDIRKSFSKEKIKINSDFNRLKKIKNNNKSKTKSKDKTKSKEKEKSKEKKLYNPINFSIDIKQDKDKNCYKKIYIDYNNIIKTNPNFNNASINIFNNFNNIHINNINNINNVNNIQIKGNNNSREKPKIYNNKHIIYNQKKKLISHKINNKNNNINDNSISNDKSKSREKEKKKRMSFNNSKNKKQLSNININFDNNYANIYSQMRKEKKIIKDEIFKIIGEKDYKYIMELYEQAFTKKDQDKIHEYFELIDKYVKTNFNSEKQEKFDNYFYSLISIDCYLNAK